MKKEDQGVSLELAREMKELGAPQDSVWYWIQKGEYIDDWSEAFLASKKERDPRYAPTLDGDCSTYTVAELGEMLPTDYSTSKFIKGGITIWCCRNSECSLDFYYRFADTEADARAKMWIFLKRKGLI